MMCPRCRRDPQPSNFADPRRCAFDTEGALFTAENWNCATLDVLRERVYSDATDRLRHYSDDQSFSVLPLGGAFLCLGWYKGRGRVELAQVVREQRVLPLNLKLAEAFIAQDDHALFMLLHPEAR